MLELRPSCEHCNARLPPEARNARICSFECTFCSHCVETILQNVCPNCGGGFSERPVRPRHNWRGDNYLGKYPPNPRARHAPTNQADHAALVARVGSVPPWKR